MKISLATNFDDNLLEAIKDYPVYEIYGKLKHDILGGGRPDNTLDEISKEVFERHVKKTREYGIKFNYLLNGSCLANCEQDTIWQQEFKNFLDYLANIGVNALTVTNPFILKLIKKYYDCFTVRVSTFACIDNYEKAKYWEDMGADYICIDFVKINRDFKTLKYMVENLKKSKIEVLATNSCLKNCPYIHTHTASLSHASNKFDNGKTFEDWCLLACQKHQLKDNSQYIKSPWIRPEDIKYYEDIGIEHFKITERGFPTEELVRRVRAYSQRKYDGNLLDLIQGHGWSRNEDDLQNINKKNRITKKSDVLKEIFKIRGLGCERRYKRHVYIENSKLDGFIDFFVKGNCKGNCNECNYCNKIAKDVIKRNDDVSDYLLNLYQMYDDMKI